MKTIVSAIYGNYDHPLSQIEQGVDRYVMFTDNKDLKSNFWEIVYLPLPYDRQLSARYIKTMMFSFFNRGDILLWIDACLTLNNRVFDEFNIGEIVFSKHPLKERTFSNALELSIPHPKYQSSKWSEIRKMGEGLSEYLASCRFLIKVGDESIRLMATWWGLIENFSRHDQLLLPIAISKSRVKPVIIDHTPYSYRHNHHLVVTPPVIK